MGKWFQDKSFSPKKREQEIKARKGHRVLGVLLAAALIFQALSFDGIIVAASESGGAGAQVEDTVTPNPLTEGMVTLSETAAVYDGYEHKPVVIVDGLDEGTDYEITYSSQDFINAGTVAITVTGKGIYAGTVEKSFTIEKATLAVRGTRVAWGTYGAKLSELTIDMVAHNASSGTGVPGWWTLTGDAIPSVGDSGEYTATFTPVSGAENYYPLTVQVTLDINPADQAAPAVPTATEENIRDNSITLTAVENGEYSLDGTTWQDSPAFTGLSPNTPYTFRVRLKADINHNASPSSTASITTRKTTLTGASVTVSGSYTYTGTALVPAVGDVTVTLNGTTIDSGQYTISTANNVNAGTATVTVTATADGNYSGSASTTFPIGKAALTIKAIDQNIICGDSITQGTGQVTAIGLCPGDTLSSVILAPGATNVSGTIIPSAVRIQNGSGADVTANYNTTYQTGTLMVSYIERPDTILYNGGGAKEWNNGEVEITAGGYTVSDTLGGDYRDSYTISAQEGTVTKTLYFKDAAGHMSDGVPVTVKFDRTAPAGEIAVGAKWWQNLLNFVSFRNYAAKEYTVTINAEDKNGSGVEKIEYVLVTGESQYTEAGTLEAADLSWTEYDSSNKPAVSAGENQYVVYARLTDKMGNVAYISTDGILLDSTLPAVESLSVPEDTLKDVTAGLTFTVSEAADYYYVVLPQGSSTPSAEDIIATCGGTLPDGTTGNVVAGTAVCGSGAVSSEMLTDVVSVEVKNLNPKTKYTVYVTVLDLALDISKSESGTPGNIGNVAQADFTTKKPLPVIERLPTISGTYGQTVGEMTLTGGIAADSKGTAVTGTWTVGAADQGKKPSVSAQDKVTVTFTPASDSFDSVSIKITPAVSPRSLTASGVAVSGVAGTYTYSGTEIRPAVAVSAGNLTSGVSVSDTGAVLTENDFIVSYSNNTDAGVNTASVTVTGQGNYAGSVTRSFTIEKASGREAPPAFTLLAEANGETDYTVIIPAAEGCEYSFDGEHWSDVNVKTGVNVGETVTGYKRYKETDNYNAGGAVSDSKTMENFTVKTPVISPAEGSYTGSVSVTITCASPDAEIYYTTDGSVPDRSSMRYTGAFTIMPEATVKAVAVKKGLTDSAVVSVTYTKKSGGGSDSNGGEDSGGSGANDGAESDNGENGGQDSGGNDSADPGNGNTPPQIPAIPPAENINPGKEAAPLTGTTPVNPENGNTSEAGTDSGSNTGTPGQGTGQPFLKGADGRTGWDVIRAEEEKAEEGSIINVDMNGSIVVPGDIFDSIKGKNITISFDMGSGILWSVDGRSITTDKAGDIDFSVKTGVNAVPADIVNDVTGESDSIRISLSYEGEFGFTAVLSIDLGRENAGLTASLYYYNKSAGGLEFICKNQVAEDGMAFLAFTHASDYVIVIDAEREEENDVVESGQTEGNAGTAGNGTATEKTPQEGQSWKPLWLAVTGVLILLMGAGVFFLIKKKTMGSDGGAKS